MKKTVKITSDNERASTIMTEEQEQHMISEALATAKEHGLLAEVMWSAITTDGTLREKLDHALNQWIK